MSLPDGTVQFPQLMVDCHRNYSYKYTWAKPSRLITPARLYAIPTEDDMRTINISEAQKDFAETVNQVASSHERVVVERLGKNLVAIVPYEDLALLENLAEEAEDKLEVDEARRILADPANMAGSVSLAEVKKKLGL